MVFVLRILRGLIRAEEPSQLEPKHHLRTPHTESSHSHPAPSHFHHPILPDNSLQHERPDSPTLGAPKSAFNWPASPPSPFVPTNRMSGTQLDSRSSIRLGAVHNVDAVLPLGFPSPPRSLVPPPLKIRKSPHEEDGGNGRQKI